MRKTNYTTSSELSLTPCKKPHFSKNTKSNCWISNRIAVLEIDGVTIRSWKGFESDGGSIPSVFWPIIGHPFDSLMIDGFWWHDTVCHTHQLSRNDADELMRSVHRRDKVPAWKRESAYRVISALPDSYYWDNDSEDLKFLKYNHDLIVSQGYSPKVDFALDIDKC